MAQGHPVLPSLPIQEVPLSPRLPCTLAGAGTTLEVVDPRFTGESQLYVLYVGEMACGLLAALNVNGELKWASSYDGVTWSEPATMFEAYGLFRPLLVIH